MAKIQHVNMNNLSKALFKQFLMRNPGARRVDSFRNVFQDATGKRYTFVATTFEDIKCTQFYPDCFGVVCYHVNSKQLTEAHREDLRIQTRPSRIGATGPAYTAHAEYIRGTLFNSI